MRKTLRLRWPLILAALAVCAAAQIVNPQENIASPHGSWIADRYGTSLSGARGARVPASLQPGPGAAHRPAPNSVLTCFAVLDPRVPLPKGGVPFGRPNMNLCDRLQLTPDQMAAPQALDPAGEPFRMGETYRLLLGGGVSVTVQVTALTESQGSFSTADPSYNSYLGAVLTVSPQDLAKFRASPRKEFVRARAHGRGLRPASGLAVLHRLDTASAGHRGETAALAPRQPARRPPIMRGPRPTPTLAVEIIAAAGQRLYLVRAELLPPSTEGRRLTPVVYAWVELDPAPHILGNTAYGTVQGSEEMEQQSILNVLGLGGGRTAILFDDKGEYHWSHELLILSPDGSLKLAHAYGATSD